MSARGSPNPPHRMIPSPGMILVVATTECSHPCPRAGLRPQEARTWQRRLQPIPQPQWRWAARLRARLKMQLLQSKMLRLMLQRWPGLPVPLRRRMRKGMVSRGGRSPRLFLIFSNSACSGRNATQHFAH